MAVLGLVSAEFAQVLAPSLPLLIAVLVAALFLFARWLETADRSAYAVGAICALVVPAWSIAVVAMRVADDPLFWMVERADGVVDLGVSWVFELGTIGLWVVHVFFAVRPVWITGLFLKAPQGAVRRRYKAMESSWQFALGALVLIGVVDLLAALLDF